MPAAPFRPTRRCGASPACRVARLHGVTRAQSREPSDRLRHISQSEESVMNQAMSFPKRPRSQLQRGCVALSAISLVHVFACAAPMNGSDVALSAQSLDTVPEAQTVDTSIEDPMDSNAGV